MSILNIPKKYLLKWWNRIASRRQKCMALGAFTLARLASYFHICVSVHSSSKKKVWLVIKFICQFHKLHYLPKMYTDSIFCFRFCLTQLRMYRKTIPLGDALSNQWPAFRIRLGSSVPLCKHH